MYFQTYPHHRLYLQREIAGSPVSSPVPGFSAKPPGSHSTFNTPRAALNMDRQVGAPTLHTTQAQPSFAADMGEGGRQNSEQRIHAWANGAVGCPRGTSSGADITRSKCAFQTSARPLHLGLGRVTWTGQSDLSAKEWLHCRLSNMAVMAYFAPQAT